MPEAKPEPPPAGSISTPQEPGHLAGQAEPGDAAAPTNASTVLIPSPGGLGETTGSRLQDQTLGPFTIVRFLGRGGMALVYEARGVDGTPVALKVMEETPFLSTELLERFRREAEASRLIDQHPNIVKVHSTGKIGNTHFIAMELVPRGRTLGSLLKAGPLPVAEALRLALQVAGALQFAHSKGIIHRDVKPGNVLINDLGDALLADFGLARLTLETGLHLTLSHASLGTPTYMSPEQTSSARIDQRADVYSFGVVLYEMLTGRLPYAVPASAGLVEVMEIVRTREPVPPRRLRPEISRNLQSIVLKLLEKEPAERYQDMDMVVQDLHACLQGRRVSAHTPNLFERADRVMRRHKVLTAASVAAALSAVGVSLHFHDLIRQARLAQLGSELESARQGREIEQLRRGGDPPRVLTPFEEGLERAHDWIRRGDLAQATAQLEELRAAAVAEARSEAARTVRRELARVALARADYALAELEFRSLARTAGHSVPGQLAQFEESVAVYLQGDVGRAAVIWRHLLESHGLTPGHRMLCRGMLGELTPAEFAARSAKELPLPRALGLWLAAERTKDTQQGQTWRRAAAAAATDVLPWLYYSLNKRPASASEPQRASEAQP